METERKHSYPDAVKEWDGFLAETNQSIKLPWENPSNDEEENDNAYRMKKEIVKYHNGGVSANGLDTNQWKEYPWFRVSGSGLSWDGCGNWLTYSVVPARLCSLKGVETGPRTLAEKYPAINDMLYI